MTVAANGVSAADPWVVYSGGPGALQGKHVVLVSGDEEYRSEEALPQLGKILARRHGCRCTVLFAIDKTDGTINPNERANIPGLEALDTADLMIVGLRFRDLPDEQMQPFVAYVDSGRPIMGLRTSTHAFNIGKGKTYARYGNGSKEWDGGFGRQVLGEQWVAHHGAHGKQSTRGLLAPGAESHPILRGIKDGDIWGPTDVYTVRLPQPETCSPLVLGQVLVGMNKDDAPLEGDKNNPMMPVAWTNRFASASGKEARIFTTTMGSSTDLVAEGTRRLLVNAAYWCLGQEAQITPALPVDIVGKFEPTPFKFNGYTKGVTPADHALVD